MDFYPKYNRYFSDYPSEDGYFGEYGGQFVDDRLRVALKEVDNAYETICHSTRFINELRQIRKDFQGRPTPIYHCERLSNRFGHCQIYLKREDLNHTGAHKLNHCMGEGLLARYMGKKKLIAETGAGQHGVAIATAAAYFGLKCDVYMGEIDIAKQAPNVTRMKLLGARVIPVSKGLKTLKEACDAAFEAYCSEYKDALYCIGTAAGPHPFPKIVRDFQLVVGEEAREQFKQMTGNLPEIVTACVGGGSNSIGMFLPFLKDPVELIGVEPLGRGNGYGEHAASIGYGKPGILHGFKSYMLQDDHGEAAPVYSIASGLDYPSVGPEHAFLFEQGRIRYETVSDEEAISAFYTLSRYEGIIPAVESSHALAFAIRYSKEHSRGSLLINLSGRGDKDMDYILQKYGDGERFLKNM